MSSRKRTLIIVAILLASMLISLIANLTVSLVQKGSYPRKYSEFVEKYASEYNVPEYIIYSVISTESDFEPKKKSSSGAYGLMQTDAGTLKLLSSYEHLNEKVALEDLSDPDIAIRYGTYYLRYLFDKFHKWNVAFAAYNTSEAQVLEWLNDTEYSKDGATLKKIPNNDTRQYLKKLNKAIDYYKKTYYRNGVSVK